jgi:arsenate reductase
MAEGLLRQLTAGQMDVASAGTEPGHVHPLAVRAMQEIGIDISQARSKSVDAFVDQHFDYVITLCDQARESCPVFPGDPDRIHWSFPDPSAVEGDDAQRYQAFARVRTELVLRLRTWVQSPLSARTATATTPDGGAA